MPDFLQTHPGYLFVAATILPLASFLLIFLANGLWCLARHYRESPGMEQLYQLTGGDKAGPLPAYLATGAIALAFVCSLTGFLFYSYDHGQFLGAREDVEHEIHILERDRDFLATALGRLPGERANIQRQIARLEKEKAAARGANRDRFDKEIQANRQQIQRIDQQLKETPKEKERLDNQIHAKERSLAYLDKAEEKEQTTAWSGKLFEVVRVKPAFQADPDRGTTLSIGFAIDTLSALMFVMVTFIATLIHIYSIGYMSEEMSETVEDHLVDVSGHHWAHAEGHTPEDHGHHGEYLRRRGRFGRFFMYLSLFCFSMLNLVLADNLFQVFVSWELVGVCSYLLIGFYYERQSASNAANKAFITNRVGDAGFILGLLIIFAYIGTFDFAGIFAQVRHPIGKDAHGRISDRAGRIVRANVEETSTAVPGATLLRVAKPGEGGSEAVLFPRKRILDEKAAGHFDRLTAGSRVEAKADRKESEYGSIPYWMLVAAGLGIFLGCVGKSAQVPLQVWLPDAMEGPTPVSALIHAATMVAAGVYLVGRVYPLFTGEVLLVIAYTGGITLFVAATIAVVMTDIKKVLAYSTVSQLGYMMLALGIGGWVAGLFHLITHAFFKALLFLCSGSVIHGCHHEQEMTKMGGLYPKMKITAITMLIGVLTIAGIPLFSGWYSKDSIIAQAAGYAYVHREHGLLFLLPLATAGITTFYMFRMWFMTFTGKPRDHHVHEHAHESPALMTGPLVALAVLSVCVAWGWPVWDATASELEHRIHHAQPSSVLADFGHVLDPAGEHSELWPEIAAKAKHQSERHFAHEFHATAGMMALGVVALGIVFASLLYYYKVLDPGEAKEQFPGIHAFLVNKWCFDLAYSVLLVRPAMIVARAFRFFDLKCIDGVIHAVARATVGVARFDGRFDNGVIDGLVNLVGRVAYNIGAWLRGAQTGYLRSYVLFLVLAAIGLFILLSYFVSMATAG